MGSKRETAGAASGSPKQNETAARVGPVSSPANCTALFIFTRGKEKVGGKTLTRLLKLEQSRRLFTFDDEQTSTAGAM